MKILYVGPLARGGTCLMRMQTLQAMGHSVTPINSDSDSTASWSERISRKLGFPRDRLNVNHRIIRLSREIKPSLLWLDKALCVRRETLEQVAREVGGVKIAGYSPDDMGGRHNQSVYFIDSLPSYDVYFTTKSFNVSELVALGAKRAVLVGNAFDPSVHRPMPVSSADRIALGGDVGFVGAWEVDRGRYMLKLARSGLSVRAWGWNPPRNIWRWKHPNLTIEGVTLWGDDYARAICSFDINLGFLRKRNRDQQTTRSVEIPACGGFMLAERTDEHLDLFEEGVEAEFFCSSDELLDKCRYYLANPEVRKAIAINGMRRCLRSGYSYFDRMRYMLSVIN